MATSLSAVLQIGLSGTRENEADKEKARVSISEAVALAFTDGTGSGQADILFSDTRTVAGGANDDLDLAGVLSDAVFGTAATFVTVKAIIIHNKFATNNIISVGGDGANGFTTWLADPTDKVVINPGGIMVLGNNLVGYAVAAGVGDILRITNTAGVETTYDIWIIGTSA